MINNSASPEDERSLAMLVFGKTQDVLAQSPGAQSEVMGDRNVAWELRDDIRRSHQLIGGMAMTLQEKAVLSDLLAALDQIPEGVFVAAVGRDSNVLAMLDPAWRPVRRLASEASAMFEGKLKHAREQTTGNDGKPADEY